jgi:DNA adenine methylase
MLPIFRWAGGKRRMIPTLLKYIPESYGTYFEPFVGAGALFFHLQPEKASINDANKDLMTAYKAIRKNGEALATVVCDWRNDKFVYDMVRKYEHRDSTIMAARFIYLNKLCVNGLWRVNQKGGFNVPYDYRRGNVCPIVEGDVLEKAKEVLKNATILTGDYANCTSMAVAGDLIFMDPPYVPFTKNGHVDYTAKGFTWSDHISLFEEFKRLDLLGCRVILTNADLPAVKELYGEYNIERVETKSSVKRTADQGSYGELIISNFKPEVKAQPLVQ